MSFRFLQTPWMRGALVHTRLLLMMSSLAIGAMASPITYDITFTSFAGLAPTSGSFTYDDAAALTSRFTNFTVTWNNTLFDFTSAANTGEVLVSTDCGTTPSSQSVFTFLSQQNVCGLAALIDWSASAFPDSSGFAFNDVEIFGSSAQIVDYVGAPVPLGQVKGSFTIAPAASTPEPATFLLVLSCGGFLLLWRRGDCAIPRVKKT